tara:strand:- start:717 stop:1448 length:732 start_codon:yes stop_codon:yes gene_type:complete
MKLSKFFSNKVFMPIGFLMLLASPSIASGVRITSYGHSALLIQGGGKTVLLNPFKAVGCASGLSEPKVSADVVLASSELLDEGARRISKGIFLSKPGSYRLAGMTLEGFSSPHDRFGGRRYGSSTMWSWKQAGMSFAHLGGSVSPLSPEDKVLIGRPDVLIIAVGGGAKVYSGSEAAKVVLDLKPRYVIPVQYVKKNTPKNCDQNKIDSFLDAMGMVNTENVQQTFFVKSKKSDKLSILIPDH